MPSALLAVWMAGTMVKPRPLSSCWCLQGWWRYLLSVSLSVTICFIELQDLIWDAEGCVCEHTSQIKPVSSMLCFHHFPSHQIKNTSSLFMLGSLVVGVPAKTFSSINGSQLLTASKNPAFVGHLLTAPQVVQQAFVTQVRQLHFCSRFLFRVEKSQICPRRY